MAIDAIPGLRRTETGNAAKLPVLGVEAIRVELGRQARKQRAAFLPPQSRKKAAKSEPRERGNGGVTANRG